MGPAGVVPRVLVVESEAEIQETFHWSITTFRQAPLGLRIRTELTETSLNRLKG